MEWQWLSSLGTRFGLLYNLLEHSRRAHDNAHDQYLQWGASGRTSLWLLRCEGVLATFHAWRPSQSSLACQHHLSNSRHIVCRGCSESAIHHECARCY